MKDIQLDARQLKKNSDIRSLNDDHKALFDYIEKLMQLVNKPEKHMYAVTILESFVTYFLEHVIKEEQILKQYLPTKEVEDHTLLHQNELNYLDESIKILNAQLSSHNIQAIAIKLNQEFKSHISQYDNDILNKLNKLSDRCIERRRKSGR